MSKVLRFLGLMLGLSGAIAMPWKYIIVMNFAAIRSQKIEEIEVRDMSMRQDNDICLKFAVLEFT